MTYLFAIEILSYALLSVTFFFYFAYFLLLRRYNKGKGNVGEHSDPHVPSFPNVSMIIPVYNEGKTIHKKLRNIESLRYPKEKMEAIFVDGCSTDNTTEIIQSHIASGRSFMKLVEQKCRKGYNEGIFDGLRNSSGEIVVLTDAGSYYDPDALHHLVKHFKNPRVGAVTGREVIVNEKRKMAAMLESTYRSYYDFMRLAETRMDSTPDLKGEISAVRREICLSTVEKARKSVNTSFDCCVPYQARMEGYRVVFEGDAFYYEYAPETFKDRMNQQIRRGTILIAALLMFKEMILNKKYGKFGTLILPSHFVMLILLPLAFLFGVAGLLVATLLNPVINMVVLAVFLIPIIVSSQVRLFVVSFIQSQVALVIAALRVLMRRPSLFIKTISSTRV